ncbi:MAG: hypothetical protein AAB770_01365 [Patescibacteria group bacterium]
MEYRKLKIAMAGQNRGTSLLELLLYIAILAGLMIVVTDAFTSLSKGRGQSQAKSEVNAAIRFATEKIRQDLKGASVVTTPILGTASSTLNLTASSTVIIYDVSSGQLRRKEGAGAYVAVTGSNITVSTPTFTRLENRNTFLGATTTAIQIAMAMSYNSSSTDWRYSASLRTAVTLR